MEAPEHPGWPPFEEWPVDPPGLRYLPRAVADLVDALFGPDWDTKVSEDVDVVGKAKAELARYCAASRIGAIAETQGGNRPVRAELWKSNLWPNQPAGMLRYALLNWHDPQRYHRTAMGRIGTLGNVFVNAEQLKLVASELAPPAPPPTTKKARGRLLAERSLREEAARARRGEIAWPKSSVWQASAPDLFDCSGAGARDAWKTVAAEFQELSALTKPKAKR